MNKTRIYLSFSAEINQATTETLLDAFAQCIKKKFDEVYLLFSTLGGQVINGMNIYNAVFDMPFKLITHNVGSVNSIGNVIFLAGEERYACPTSNFMFHGVSFTFQKQTQLEEKDLEEKLESIKSDNTRIKEVIKLRTNFKNKDIDSMFRQGKTIPPAIAKKNGIIQDIREVNIPQGAPFNQFVFQRQTV